MASIKVKFRPSTNENKEGTIYYQIIQNRVIRQLKTDYRLFLHEWNEKENSIIATNNSRQNYLQSIQERIDWDIKRLHPSSSNGRISDSDTLPIMLFLHSRNKPISNRCSTLCKVSLPSYNRWANNAHRKPIVARSKVLCSIERIRMYYWKILTPIQCWCMRLICITGGWPRTALHSICEYSEPFIIVLLKRIWPLIEIRSNTFIRVLIRLLSEPFH